MWELDIYVTGIKGKPVVTIRYAQRREAEREAWRAVRQGLELEAVDGGSITFLGPQRVNEVVMRRAK